jgi:inhibitor of Bruton tyrosine kinase
MRLPNQKLEGMNSTNHALHVYYILRDQQAFQKLLEVSKQSLSRTPHRKPHSTASLVDVNARDEFGRTVLHLSCSDPSPTSLEYVKLLLTHPCINLNLQDEESHWTALHRAGYVGNIAAWHVYPNLFERIFTLAQCSSVTPGCRCKSP